jgi:protein-arginine kinase activator protein McsA
MDDLQADIAEATALLEQATRPVVCEALRRVLKTQGDEVKKMEIAAAGEKERQEKRERDTAAAMDALAKELAALEVQKVEAVANEDYEACAKIRDQVHTPFLKSSINCHEPASGPYLRQC